MRNNVVYSVLFSVVRQAVYVDSSVCKVKVKTLDRDRRAPYRKSKFDLSMN